MIGSNSLKVAGDGIAMFEGSGGILEYIAKKHPRSEVRVMAVRYLLKMIRELSGDEYSTRKELLMQNANTIENSGKEYERDEAVSK